MQNPTPFPELYDVLKTLVDGIHRELGQKLTGAYLQGSFALGGYDEHSDADFIVVIREELSADEVERLQKLHQAVFLLPQSWAQHLEGSYFPEGQLRDLTQSGRPLWYLDNGSNCLCQSGHCNTLLVRWILREKGLTLCGPAPDTFLPRVPTADLRRDMLDVLFNWGNEILSDPGQYNNRFYQGFIVLSYCRMLHDYLNGFPGSKTSGAAWASQNLDPVWTGLIKRSWATRPQPELRIREKADPEDFAATLSFVRYVMREAGQYLSDPKA